MIGPDLTSDCSRCTALCCMTMAFDKGADFAVDKPAGQGCVNLGPDFRCTIHDTRAEQGFSGCLRFDCLGAGQRVTQDLFPGVDWRKTPADIPRIIEAFRRVRDIHRLYELLAAAGALPLTAELRAQRAELMEALHPVEGLTQARLADVDVRRLEARTAQFLGALKTLATGAGMAKPS